MNYFDRVQKAVDYIEDNMTQELSLEDIASQKEKRMLLLQG